MREPLTESGAFGSVAPHPGHFIGILDFRSQDNVDVGHHPAIPLDMSVRLLTLQTVQYLQHVAMRQHRRRLLLKQFVVATRESGPLFRRHQESLRLGNQPLALSLGNRRFLLRQPFVDHYDECRKLAQPLECGVLQHQLQILPASNRESG